MAEVFEHLESNDKEAVENAKQSLRDQFLKVTDPWLLNGLYEYYLHTNSIRSMEILVNVPEPHHLYMFERLSESIRNQKTEVKVQALTLLGHVARSQPTWLYKIQDHVLLRDVLRLLKTEVELLPLISALLLLIVLLPMLPSVMGGYLKDIFDIFSRLASWNCSPGKYVEDQNVHMQVALYALFLRLYGMYPCNFLGYLRSQYREKNNPVFVHTIKPMLDTVRMHPALVTASKDNETTTERWKKMGVHDVIVECERFSLDLTDRCPHDVCQYSTGFRSRSGTTNSSIEPSFRLQDVKCLASLPPRVNTDGPFFTPSMAFQTSPISDTNPENIPVQGPLQTTTYQPEGASPPEAAIEATPETTPIRDYRVLPPRSQPLNSNIARALTSFNTKARASSSKTATPPHSQPSSPMIKEMSAFSFYSDNKSGSALVKSKRESFSKQKFNKLILERSQVAEASTSSMDHYTKSKSIPTPSSPVRIVSSDTVSKQFILHQRVESPTSREDEEVGLIVSKRDTAKQVARPCDSVLPEFDDGSPESVGEEQEHGSPCTAGGLHMPNSKSMNSFAKRVQRLRYHSQCNPEPERIGMSTGSSPGNSIPFPNSTTVRRANSCPEMKKSPVIPTKDNMGKPLDETDEETTGDIRVESLLSTSNTICLPEKVRRRLEVTSCSTQTENFWPMPYEHLFLGIFPSLENNEIKPSPAPSPAPFNFSQEKYTPPSIYDILDKYIETAANCNERNTSHPQYLKEQLQLLHQQLLFERHRRETHAYRNRRLLSDARNTRLLEECNSALRDTVQLQQRDIDELRQQIDVVRRAKLDEEKKLQRTIQYWENQCITVEDECRALRQSNEMYSDDLNEMKKTCSVLHDGKQKAESELFEAVAEVNVAREKAWVGERGRQELEQVNRELLLIGELQLKYKEKLEQLSSMRRSDEELERIKEAYKDDLRIKSQHLEAKAIALEAARARVIELEQAIMSKEELITIQKRTIRGLTEERYEKLEAVESKYQTQLTINRALEEKILDLRQRLEIERARKAVHSPDTSSCHEVNVTTTAGVSPHSSPLSASLASSEGSAAFHDKEVKNLQAIVDQTESTSKLKVDEAGEELTDQTASSSKTD